MGPGWPPAQHTAAAQIRLPLSPIESQLGEWQRLYNAAAVAAAAAGIGSAPGLPPGWGPSPNLAAELLQRERLDQLG